MLNGRFPGVRRMKSSTKSILVIWHLKKNEAKIDHISTRHKRDTLKERLFYP